MPTIVLISQSCSRHRTVCQECNPSNEKEAITMRRISSVKYKRSNILIFVDTTATVKTCNKKHCWLRASTLIFGQLGMFYIRTTI